MNLKCRTFPTWNILLYNAIGGSGDELYGIEPMSYYVRNLALNINISWPLAAAAPILLLRESLYSMGNISLKTKNTAVIFLPVIIWLSVLFTRPHKVSRVSHNIAVNPLFLFNTDMKKHYFIFALTFFCSHFFLF